MSTYEISKSSLLSLKAEIIRKQEDFAKTKSENAEKIKLIKKKTPLELKNKGVDERSKGDIDEEEQNLLKLSREKLESKAKLYDKLSSDKNTTGDSRYLVRFDKKAKNSNRYVSDEEIIETEEKDFSDNYDDEVDPSEEWVEYVDCLGRSRKCLRKDLEYFKSKDADLKSVVEARKEPQSPEPEQETEEGNISNEEENKDDSELTSVDLSRNKLHQQWDEEEEELKNRTDIHYQNVLFNEARQHGVGYYAFSKDEEKRKQQQEALRKLRKDTELEQKKAQELRMLRDKQMAARIKAARNRRRARLGLPPEEETEEPTDNSGVNPNEEEVNEEKTKEEEEKEKRAMEKRKKHVRPWDIGKDGVKEHYVMSQEEWNDKKRKERPSEFAPPTTYQLKEKSNFRGNSGDIDTSSSDEEDQLLHDYKKSQISEQYQSSKSIRKSINPYKNNQNEIDESSNNPTPNKKQKTEQISNSIEAGLRFLRQQIEKNVSK